MSEKQSQSQKSNLNNPKNITKTKSLIQKSKITRNSQTPIKSQMNPKTFINNNINNNTLFHPNNNNYNINNNISININIDMTNERNKSFNTKTKNSKPQSKKNQNFVKKSQNQLSNNNLIFNTIKNFKKKPSDKKSPFHIRINSANLGLKDLKFKQNDNMRNKVYQNRLNYYYNISNKNNFNIFSHKFESKKPENNSNITKNTYKNISLNHTPLINAENKNKKEISKSTKDLVIKDQKLNNKYNIIKSQTKNTNTNSKKTFHKKNYFSPINNKEIQNKNKNNKNQTSTPIHSNKLNRSTDNRKLKNNNNKISNIKYSMINNNRNMSTSPFSKNQKIINHNTIDYDIKNKNKDGKNHTIIKSPVNSKLNNNIFKYSNKMNNTGTNFRSPMINNKNISKLNKNKNNKKPEKEKEKDNNVKKEQNLDNNVKEKEKINKENIKLDEDIIIQDNIEKDFKENEPEKEKEKNEEKIIEKENIIGEKKVDNKEKIIEEKKEEVKEEKKEGIKEEEKQVKVEIKDILNINSSKNDKPIEEKKEASQFKDQNEISAELFINQIFQSSLTFDPNPNSPQKKSSSPNKKIVSKLESICKVGYAGPGVKKKNQDNFFIYKNFIDDSDTIFLGVCDGHGMFGHDISGYLVNMLPQNLHESLTKSEIKKINLDSDFQKITDIASQTFVQTNLNLVNNSSIDCTYSGSTCSSLIFSPEKIISINVGDSRCVLGKCVNNKWTSKNLTRDHKPTEEDEKKRILDKGGRIEAYKDDQGVPIGPERVWLKGEDLPGLAMSRSFGDDVAHMIGVTSKPEIMEFKLYEEDKFILLGSDGIFEFISSDEAVNMVKDFYLKDDINGALNHLYKISSQRWIMEEEVIDDITLIIVFFK